MRTLIHASDDELENWITRTMDGEGLAINAKESHHSAARAETRPIQRGGGRFVTVACSTSEVFHNAADRWPEAIDVGILGLYARAFANGTLELARQSS